MTAFSESIVAPYRRSRRDGERAEAALAALGTLAEVTGEVASRAAQLRAARNIKLPDAFVLATAIQAAADQILTLDRRWRGVDPRVQLLEL
jgi:predicted nucleic acid-binding protein